MSTTITEWEPGEPLYDHPTERRIASIASGGSAYAGNYVRPMIELIDDFGGVEVTADAARWPDPFHFHDLDGSEL